MNVLEPAHGAPGDDGSEVRPAVPVRSAGSLLEIEAVPAIEHDEVHVWAFELAASTEQYARCVEVLSSEEQEKASRFVFERHRNAYVVSHGVLRALIGAYAKCPPQSLRWICGPNGKPALAGDQAGRLSFNLSHSGSRALLAVAGGAEIGADLEQHRAIEAASIADRFFFGAERDAIRTALEPDAIFYRYWTAKEAVMKGCGAGLSLPLDQFGVMFQAASRATVQTRNPALLAPDWTVQTLAMDEGWSAAVAARGSAWRVAPQGGSHRSAD